MRQMPNYAGQVALRASSITIIADFRLALPRLMPAHIAKYFRTSFPLFCRRAGRCALVLRFTLFLYVTKQNVPHAPLKRPKDDTPPSRPRCRRHRRHCRICDAASFLDDYTAITAITTFRAISACTTTTRKASRRLRRRIFHARIQQDYRFRPLLLAPCLLFHQCTPCHETSHFLSSAFACHVTSRPPYPPHERGC